MAIFEKKFERKITLDDTQSLSCVIETAQEVDGHTVSASIERKKKYIFSAKNTIAQEFIQSGSLKWNFSFCGWDAWPFKFSSRGGVRSGILYTHKVNTIDRTS